jgi:hypothetical protein
MSDSWWGHFKASRWVQLEPSQPPRPPRRPRRRLAAAEEQARKARNPVLLDHLPVAEVILDGMRDQTSRRLFEALRLEIRYDPPNRIARCSIILTGDTIDAVSRTTQEGNDRPATRAYSTICTRTGTITAGRGCVCKATRCRADSSSRLSA